LMFYLQVEDIHGVRSIQTLILFTSLARLLVSQTIIGTAKILWKDLLF
jgi:hypothetical protein